MVILGKACITYHHVCRGVAVLRPFLLLSSDANRGQHNEPGNKVSSLFRRKKQNRCSKELFGATFFAKEGEKLMIALAKTPLNLASQM
jgi:hypothetical protein